MKKYRGTEKGPEGVYVNLSTGEFVQLREKVRVLPGSQDTSYMRVPSLLAVVTGPLAGLAFIIFLPFIGIIGLAGFLGYRLWKALVSFGDKVVQLVAIGWHPEMAYFARRGSRPAGKPDAATGGEMSELEKEINRQKARGEQ